MLLLNENDNSEFKILILDEDMLKDDNIGVGVISYNDIP